MIQALANITGGKLLEERLIRLQDAGRMLTRPDGRCVSRCTTWRWASKGIRGRDGRRVRLETLKIGAGVYTTLEAIERFSAALSGDGRRMGDVAVEQLRRRRGPQDLRTQQEADLKAAGWMD